MFQETSYSYIDEQKSARSVEVAEKSIKSDTIYNVGRITLVIVTILLFLLSVDLMSSAFQGAGKSAAESLLSATSNPFVGLFIGLLLTALIQSSSTSTSMIVVLVGTGAISLPAAVPMVMGANIGTTLTSTLVSLGFISIRREFRKAISAGVVHDFYNVILTVILFPLEYYYHLLSRLSTRLADALSSVTFAGAFDTNSSLLFSKSLGTYITEMAGNSWILIILSILLLFGTIKVMSQIIYSSLIGESKDKLKEHIFSNPYKSFGWGGVLTAAVQSSSITTSLIIPLVATGRVSLQKAFPFIIGANIGTTITALIVALFKSEAAVSIALVHLLFNLSGVLLFLPFNTVRRTPGIVAAKFGRLTQRNRIYGFLYIILMFFILPFVLIYFYKSGHMLP